MLAQGRVRHVGDPIALVVAETLEQAKDAAELIEVDYEPLPAVVETALARDEGAPQIWPEALGNIALDWSIGDEAATEAAFARADAVVEVALVNNRVIVAPMEPRSALGQWDPVDGRFTLHACSQGAHKLRNPLAEGVLKVPRESLRVVTPSGRRQFVSHNGIVGHAVRKIGEFTYPWAKDGMLVEHWHEFDKAELIKQLRGR